MRLSDERKEDVRHIPERFQADCVFCGEVLDIRQDGTYQHTSGWVRRRHDGGGNAIALPQRTFEFAHELCIDSAKHRAGSVQLPLFS